MLKSQLIHWLAAFALAGLFTVFSGTASATSTPVNGSGQGDNVGEPNQNIVANCNQFNTQGLQQQEATTRLNCVDGNCTGSISYVIAATQQAIGFTILQLALGGGSFEGPFGISGSISVLALALVNGAINVQFQLLGSCTGGSLQADFAGLLLLGVVFQNALTILTESTAFSDGFRQDLRTLTAFNPLTFIFAAALLGDNDKNGIIPIANGLRMRGGNAGDGFGYPWGMWATYQRDEAEDDFAATAYESDTDTLMAGVDFSIWDNVTTGAAIGYSSSDIDTTFNSGEGDVNSFSVIPYMAIYMSDYVGVDFDLMADMKIGFSFVDIDQFRTTAGNRVTSSTDANRYFFSANVTAGQNFGAWRLDGRAGWLIARENRDGFSESDGTAVTDGQTDFGQLSLGGEAAYNFGAFEPFTSATYLYDYQTLEVTTAGAQPANDKDSVLVGAGVRWYGDVLSASFVWNGEIARENFDANTFMFTLRSDY